MGRLVLIALLAIAATVVAIPITERLATIDDRYIVVFKDNADVDALTSRLEADASVLTADFEITRKFYTALKGVAVKLDKRSLAVVNAAPEVKYVEKDAIGELYVTPESWGLDRTDQRDLPYDNDFDIQGDGTGVNVYVLDTGIRETHEEFGGRAYKDPIDFLGDDWNGTDCHGHGTHCAGTAAGGLHGVARNANIIGIRIFDCNGFGSVADTLAAFDYITKNAVLPAVVSMSFGFRRQASIDEAVDAASARGIIMVAAAGNSDTDACLFSPAGSPSVISVAASNSDDERAYFSNYGDCVELFAPGVAITSSSPASDRATATWSGTSMACPHVAGAAAVHLGNGVPASEVRDRILSDASMNKIYDTRFETPNKLLYLD